MMGVSIMEKSTKVISFNQLKEGMVIAKNVEQNGSVLLKKDISVTEQIIEKIKKLYVIGNVEIYCENIAAKSIEVELKKETQCKKD